MAFSNKIFNKNNHDQKERVHLESSYFSSIGTFDIVFTWSVTQFQLRRAPSSTHQYVELSKQFF